MSNGDDVEKSIRRTLNWLVGATAVLFVCGAAVAGYVYVQGETTQSALCTLRAERESEVERSREFLRERPEGPPGIPASVIREGIRSQEVTVDALSVVSC